MEKDPRTRSGGCPGCALWEEIKEQTSLITTIKSSSRPGSTPSVPSTSTTRGRSPAASCCCWSPGDCRAQSAAGEEACCAPSSLGGLTALAGVRLERAEISLTGVLEAGTASSGNSRGVAASLGNLRGVAASLGNLRGVAASLGNLRGVAAGLDASAGAGPWRGGPEGLLVGFNRPAPFAGVWRVSRPKGLAREADASCTPAVLLAHGIDISINPTSFPPSSACAHIPTQAQALHAGAGGPYPPFFTFRNIHHLASTLLQCTRHYLGISLVCRSATLPAKAGSGCTP